MNAVADPRVLAIRECAALARFYADENLLLGGDTLLLDPVLNGEGTTPGDVAKSRDLRTWGTIHAASYHAGRHIEANILALIGEEPEE